MAVFLLPMRVLKSIEEVCNKFLWGVGVNGRKRAPVSWSRVAMPKMEGGLGIRDFKTWNKACVLRHLWNLLAKAGSLWVAWIQKYRIKGNDLWGIAANSVSSWVWKKVLKCREVAHAHVNGTGSSLTWDGKKLVKYSVKTVWNSIRIPSSSVDWFSVLWGKPFIMKHSLLVWLVVLDRITTKDHLASWGLTDVNSCVLCPGGLESRDHLFSLCSFSKAVFQVVLKKICRWPDFTDWSSHLRWVVQRWSGTTSPAKIGRLLWVMCCAYIWRERCTRVYGVKRISDPSQLSVAVMQEFEIYASSTIELQKMASVVMS
ncbi:unnamed protein product [Linum tenue]|nr:unnamed protein product [Linum tenue]